MVAAASEGFAIRPCDCHPSCHLLQVVEEQVPLAAGCQRVLPIVDPADHQVHQAGMPEGAHPVGAVHRLGWASH